MNSLLVKSKVLTYFSMLLIVFGLSSCGIGLLVRGVAKKSITVEKGVVPPNFIKSNQTLIVLMWGTKSYDKYAMKAFNRFYDGKKIYLSLNDLLTVEKYQDLERFPYVFSQGPGDMTMYSGKSYSYTYSGSRPFHILDRKEGKFYNSRINSGFFYRIMQAYAMKLNKHVK